MSRKFGIDVSHYQLEIDWKAVKEQGIEFAILKCQYESQSHRIDEYFERNYAGCQQNGISTGVYIFVGTKSIEDPEHDANCLLGHLKGRLLEYGIWIDLEAAAVRALGKKKITELVRVYERIFKNAGYYVGIYSNLDWYRNVLDVNALSDIDMWIARYPKNDDGTLRESLNPGVGVAWQYSSKGRLRGIRNVVEFELDPADNIAHRSDSVRACRLMIRIDRNMSLCQIDYSIKIHIEINHVPYSSESSL